MEDIKINGSVIVSELKNVLNLIIMGYRDSTSSECDVSLKKAIGKLETIVKILEEDDN